MQCNRTLLAENLTAQESVMSKLHFTRSLIASPHESDLHMPHLLHALDAVATHELLQRGVAFHSHPRGSRNRCWLRCSICVIDSISAISARRLTLERHHRRVVEAAVRQKIILHHDGGNVGRARASAPSDPTRRGGSSNTS